jgi:hypothetical protein
MDAICSSESRLASSLIPGVVYQKITRELIKLPVCLCIFVFELFL